MVLAINFKQMALYFAIPFGVYALAILVEKMRSPNTVTHIDGIVRRVFFLIIVFAATNALIWTPWIFKRSSESSLIPFDFTQLADFADGGGALAVLTRIFPIRRGLFEDKVSTFWCVLHYSTPFTFLKVNTSLPRELQFKLATGVTLLFCMPACLLLWQTPTKRQFVLSILAVSTSFFLFSFQVHEK